MRKLNSSGWTPKERHENNARTQGINSYGYERQSFATGGAVDIRQHHMDGDLAEFHNEIDTVHAAKHFHQGKKEKFVEHAADTARKRAQGNTAISASTLISLSNKRKRELDEYINSPAAMAAFDRNEFFTTPPIKMRAMKVDSSATPDHRYYKKKPRTLTVGARPHPNVEGAYLVNHFEDIGGSGKSYSFAKPKKTNFDEDA